MRFDRFLNVTAGVLRSYGRHTFGLKVKGDLRDFETEDVEALWTFRSAPKSVLKVKANAAHNVAVSVETPIEKWGSWTLGINVDDFGRTNRFSYGLQMNLDL